jgi:hypothetical protein
MRARLFGAAGSGGRHGPAVKAAAAEAWAAVDAADEMRASLAADDGPVRVDCLQCVLVGLAAAGEARPQRMRDRP